ncbi:MAG: hypothetical protein LBR32_03665, partial [Propionibacteriaceae bacterium]|nr:hypothetical protein [Propionibacteriaceae bacterium]
MRVLGILAASAARSSTGWTARPPHRRARAGRRAGRRAAADLMIAALVLGSAALSAPLASADGIDDIAVRGSTTSVTMGGTTTQVTGETLYAYAKEGETLTLTATYKASDGNPRYYYAAVLTGPDGTTPAGAPAAYEWGSGTDDFTATITATATGVYSLWIYSYLYTDTALPPTPASNSDNGRMYHLYAVDWTVAEDGVAQPGRVWTKLLHLTQTSAWSQTAGLSVYVVQPNGSVYQVDYADYNGLTGSLLYYDPFGNTASGECVSAYASATYDGKTAEYAPASASCGEKYNLFFDEPAADLPASYVDADGVEHYILPTYQAPSKPTVAYQQGTDKTAQLAGTFTVGTDNFVGSFEIHIDANGNGIYDEAGIDLVVPGAVSESPGSFTYEWDGLDASGNVVPRKTKVSARVDYTKMDELHSDLQDVEQSGGQTWTQLAGYAASRAGGPVAAPLMWNDQPATRTNYTAADVLPGISSAGDTTPNTHYWDSNITTGYAPGATVANGGFGNSSYIDTWTYVAVDADSDPKMRT